MRASAEAVGSWGRVRSGDVVVITKLDRPGQPVANLVELAAARWGKEPERVCRSCADRVT